MKSKTPGGNHFFTGTAVSLKIHRSGIPVNPHGPATVTMCAKSVKSVSIPAS
jgi:hypothetical protein